MKILRFIYLLPIALLLFITSCNEEITSNPDAKQIPVVFGLLDATDSIHFIKITRTFSGTNNAIDVAQIEDSSYFDQVDVTVEEVLMNQVTRTWTLKDTTITNKEPGAFYSPNQKCYYFETTTAAPLKTNATYRMKAIINNGEFTVTGETAMTGGLGITNPNPLGSFNFMSAANGVVSYTNQTCKVNNGNAKIMDARLTVYFDEYFNGNPVEKSFVWKLGELNGDDIQGTSSIFLANGKNFFELIKSNVTNDPTINKRQFTKITLTFTGGTDDLSKYILINKPSNSLAQNKPTFTNLITSDGRGAIGLFSSRYKVSQTKIKWQNFQPYTRGIDKNSVIELCTGPITGNLLFCSDHPTDIANGESFVCQ